MDKDRKSIERLPPHCLHREKKEVVAALSTFIVTKARLPPDFSFHPASNKLRFEDWHLCLAFSLCAYELQDQASRSKEKKSDQVVNPVLLPMLFCIKHGKMANKGNYIAKLQR